MCYASIHILFRIWWKKKKIREKDKEVILRKKKYFFFLISFFLSLKHVAVFFQIRQFRTLECHNETEEDEEGDRESEVEDLGFCEKKEKNMTQKLNIIY